MDILCKTCSEGIDMHSLYTVCEGRCAKKFHATCVGVSETQLCALTKNIVWICDDCMFEYCRARDRIPESPKAQPVEYNVILAHIADLKSQIEIIVNSIAELPTSIACPTSSVSTQRHSTPINSPKPLNSVSACRSECSRSSTHNRGDSFSLLLTNIDRRATENEITSLVSQSLCVPEPECMDVTKLVPRWKSCANLDFISFKVVLPGRWKQLALNASTWPREVKVREFTCRKNIDPWKPPTLRNITI